jgi:hypothetical protein
MKTKITLLRLVLLLIRSITYSKFATSKLVKTLLLSSQKIIEVYPISHYLRTTSILMDLVAKNMEKSIKMTQPILKHHKC